MAPSLVTSMGKILGAPPCVMRAQPSAMLLSRSARRAVMTNFEPRAESSFARASPNPEEAPASNTRLPAQNVSVEEDAVAAAGAAGAWRARAVATAARSSAHTFGAIGTNLARDLHTRQIEHDAHGESTRINAAIGRPQRRCWHPSCSPSRGRVRPPCMPTCR